LLQRDPACQKTLTKYVYVHLTRDKDTEAYELLKRRVKAPVHAVPQINILKPDGKLFYTQCGPPQTLNATLDYKAKELAGDKAIAELAAEFKAALKEADDLVAAGQFITAYDKLESFPEGMTHDDKTLKRLRATVGRIEEAALAKLDEGKRLLDEGGTEAQRLDGAYQIIVVWAGLGQRDRIRAKAFKVMEAGGDAAKKDLLKQAGWLRAGRDEARKGNRANAKKWYEDVIKYHADTEAAKRAKAKLEELERK